MAPETGVSTEAQARDGAGRSSTAVASRTLGVLGTLILAVTALVCAALFLPRFFGITPYVVSTGSMEPALPVGSVVYAQAVAPAELQEGDVVTFASARQGDSVVTHRVVANDPAAQELTTQGDANTAPDPDPVAYERVRGVMAFSVPVLGILAAGLSSGGGKLALLAVVAGGLALCFAADHLRHEH